MIRTSRMGPGVCFAGEIPNERPVTNITNSEIDYKLFNKSKLIEYAESIGIDIPKKATMEQIYISIENKDN